MDARTRISKDMPVTTVRPFASPHGPDAVTGDGWILVAGATSARLYVRSSGELAPAPLRMFEASPSAIDPAELHAHEAARRSARIIAGARLATPMSPQRRRHLQFAAVLAAYLEQEIATGRCRAITLVAGCPFLGALRRALPPAVRRAAATVIDQDLCDLAPEALAKVLRGERRLAA
jgi:protein required for attachment to host cells